MVSSDLELYKTTPKPFIFVLMPFDPNFNDIYKFGIKGAAEDVGAYAERVDEQIFMEGILDRIFNQISKADVIIADMTGRNPNVFYEVGYAHALGKTVILLTQDSKDIPFDLKHRQHTVYKGKIETLRKELAIKLEWAIREAKKKANSQIIEQISLYVWSVRLPEGNKEISKVEVKGATTSNSFYLPIFLKNDGLEIFHGASHVYLFTSKDCPVTPVREIDNSIYFAISSTSTSSMNYSKQEAYEVPFSLPFDTNLTDTTDYLSAQYQLPINFSSLPPGAVERKYLELMFKNGKNTCNDIFRIRLHTKVQYHDYSFRLILNSEKRAD